MRNIFNFAILTVFSLYVFGCGERNATEYIEGTVTYKGAPVEEANISFSPTASEGVSAFGHTDAKGKYVIQTLHGAVGRGTTPGEYKVTITKTVGIPTGEKRKIPGGSEFEVMKYEEMLPKAYVSITSTPLTVTVTKGGPNKFDFDLVDKP